jgi:hypothetical protein
VNVFNANDVNISATAPPAIQGWRDGRGLWMVPIVDQISDPEPTATKKQWACTNYRAQKKSSDFYTQH